VKRLSFLNNWRQIDRDQPGKVGAHAFWDRNLTHPARACLQRVLVDKHEVAGPIHLCGKIENLLCVDGWKIIVATLPTGVRPQSSINSSCGAPSGSCTEVGRISEVLGIRREPTTPGLADSTIARFRCASLSDVPGDIRRDRRWIERDLRDETLMFVSTSS
jgi:hypothetical protein